MAVEYNILDAYRSVTYNFTLAALTSAQLSDPKQAWRNSPLKLVIASSKGKGANAIQGVDGNALRNAQDSYQSASTDLNATTDSISASKKTLDGLTSASDLINTFNKYSPGAYDLWVDNVEIDTIMAPNEQTGPALGTKVAFEVYEPYSVNGFIEALHVAAQAAGWDSYLNATFLLKIEFSGYPINGNKAIKIDADKYIPIKMTGAEIEVSEQGTKYRCKGIPVNEIAMSNPNKLTASRQMVGATVGEVLKDLVNGLNDGIKDRAQKEKVNPKTTDSYEIWFPDYPTSGNAIALQDTNKIKDAKINEILKQNNVYQFQDLSNKSSDGKPSDPQNKYDPKNSIVQFPANADVIDIITAVVRDSQYLKDILTKLKDEAASADGMVDYFQIITKAEPTEFDKANNRQCYKFIYIITPYKVHSSQLPDQQNNKFDPKQFDKLVKREYNYLYGGKNVDVINFKLNFNNLYFQAANANQGAKPNSELSTAEAPPDTENKKKPDQEKNTDVNGKAPVAVIPQASGNDNRAGAVKGDPYFQLAYNAHQMILESVNLITGDIELLGDPYYLCTSGLGNYLAETKEVGLTADGEANINSAPCVVRFNFRNPIDIAPNGFLNFGSPAPFSGLYKVIKCVSKFNDGMFKQSLKVIRYQGQIDPTSNDKPIQAPPLVSEKKASDYTTADTAPASAQSAGSRPPTLDLLKMIGKGLPTNGLPGSLNQALASGSFIPGISDYLTGGTSGGGAADIASAASGLLGNASSVFGGGGLSSLAGAAGKLSSLASNPLGALSNLANGAVSGIGSLVSNPTSLLGQASGVVSQGINAINQGANGIGLQVGSSLSGINPLTSGVRLDTSAISNTINQIQTGISASDAATNMISNVTSVNGLNLGADQRSAVISNALSNGISPDLALRSASTLGVNLPGVSGLNPGALAEQLGIDPSQLAGLGGSLGSDLTKQLSSISKSLPENVNLGDAKKLGISLENLDQVTIKNLPAIPPLNVTAPDVLESPVDALVDNPGDPKILSQFGMTPALGAFKADITGSLPNLDTLKSNLTGSIPSASGLVANAQSGFGSSITSQLGSLSGGSPLDKLNIPSVDSLTSQASDLTSSISSNLGIG